MNLPFNRYIESHIEKDLEKKMILLAGPRQVGKTTLTLKIIGASSESDSRYLNWDDLSDKKLLLKGFLPEGEFIILDEIHKYKNWRNLLKGFYDKNKSSKKFLVTGSARLDHYRKGGDSLQGRYHFFRLHPFSLYELNASPTNNDLQKLLKFGGFPEPLFANSEVEWKRWQKERISKVVRDDLVNLENVKELSLIEILMEMLKERAASLLSINSLREDLNSSHEAVEKWVQILENLYYCFRISPYTTNKIKGMRKEKKVFLWDWSVASTDGAIFENLVASNLLKYCHFHEDVFGEDMQLCFIRDKEKREIDFVVLKNKKPIFAVECKTGEKKLSPHIKYFSSRLTIPIFYQVHLGNQSYESAEHRAKVIPFTQFCKILGV